MFNLFRFNYDKPGRGVSENEAKKKGVFLFFEIYFSKIKSMIMLNVLFIITSIPIVTLGPSFAALTSVLKNYADGDHSWGAPDYFSAFKRHFRQGFAAGIVTLLFGFGFVYNLIYFAFFAEGLMAVYITWLLLALTVLLIIVHGYVYTLMVTTKQSVLELFTDAFILALARLPMNLLVAAASLIYPVIILWIYFMPSLPMAVSAPIASSLALFTMFSFVQFAAVFYTGSVIKKYSR